MEIAYALMDMMDPVVMTAIAALPKMIPDFAKIVTVTWREPMEFHVLMNFSAVVVKTSAD